MPSIENITTTGGLTFEAEPLPIGGSIESSGNLIQTMQYDSQGSNGPFALKGGDFTIEWFNYLIDPAGQRWGSGGIFWSFFTCEIYETNVPGQGFIRVSDDTTVFFALNIPDVWNVWDHYAITRTNNVMRLFRNGQQIGTNVTTSKYFLSSQFTFNLFSGNQLRTRGRITNFNWVVGTSLYSSNFTPPTSPILPVPGCQLLLRASTPSTVFADSSGTGKVPRSAAGLVYSPETPFIS